MSEKLKKLLQLNLNQRNSSENIDTAIDPIVADDSLSYEYSYETDVLTKIYKTGIFIICALFSILLIINAYFNMQLRSLLREQNSLIVRIGRLKDIENDALSVSSKINYYKNVLGNRVDLGEEIASLMSVLSQQVSVQKLYFSYDDFEINIQVPNPVTFARLINLLLGDKVEYLIIQSANYNTTEQNYDVSLKGKFKID